MTESIKHKWLLFLLLMTCTLGMALNSSASTDTTLLKGWVADRYPITMMLIKNNHHISGWYYYDRKKIRIRLIGTISPTTLSLTEYVGSDTTGYFDGTVDDSNHISGAWAKTKAEDDDSRKFFQLIRQDYFEKMMGLVNAFNKDPLAQKINVLSYAGDTALVLNSAYLSHCSEPEKAILAFYSTQSGSKCWWNNNEPDDNYTNLSCGLTTALGLGFQCSDLQKKIIKKWFADDPLLLADADNCYSVPYTATVQNTFNAITLTRLNEYVLVQYENEGVNMREQYEYTYRGIGIFRMESNRVVRVFYK